MTNCEAGDASLPGPCFADVLNHMNFPEYALPSQIKLLSGERAETMWF